MRIGNVPDLHACKRILRLRYILLVKSRLVLRITEILSEHVNLNASQIHRKLDRQHSRRTAEIKAPSQVPGKAITAERAYVNALAQEIGIIGLGELGTEHT